MNLTNHFLVRTFLNIKRLLPPYVLKAIVKLIPASFLLSVFELFGLAVLFPVINIVIKPELINSNQFFNTLFNLFYFKSNVQFVLFLFLIIAFCFILKNILVFLASKRQAEISYGIAQQLSINQYQRYLNQTYTFHTKNNSAHLLTNISVIPFDFVAGILLPFIAIINELLLILLIVAVIIYYDFLLFFSLIIITIPFLFFYFKTYKRKLEQIAIDRDRGIKSINKNALQSIQCFREIVVFNKKDFFNPIFENAVKQFSKGNSSLYLLNSFSPKIIESIAVISIVGIFFMNFLFGKELNALSSFLVLFSIAAYRLIPSLNRIILSMNNIKASFYVFDYFAKEKETTVPAVVKSSINYRIAFEKYIKLKDISFSYSKGSDDILNSINLTIKKGKTIGVIGTSGSGKSTLLNILLRLHKEKTGGIYVDDKKIDDEEINAWYNLISYVPQDIVLMDGTVAENIAFGINIENVDNDLIKEVVQKAQLTDFINNLGKGINTQIGEKGLKISGGQKQRIAIARALYHGGKVLIFDEATSSLDNETEQMLTEAIRNISQKNITIIIVAHRLQTLKYCDEIYKLEKGVLSNRALKYEDLVVSN